MGGSAIARKKNAEKRRVKGEGAGRQSIPDKEKGLLFLKSGGICAFRGCERHLIEPGGEGEADAIIGEMAHIVPDSRQGPRGGEPLDKGERNKRYGREAGRNGFRGCSKS